MCHSASTFPRGIFNTILMALQYKKKWYENWQVCIILYFSRFGWMRENKNHCWLQWCLMFRDTVYKRECETHYKQQCSTSYTTKYETTYKTGGVHNRGIVKINTFHFRMQDQVWDSMWGHLQVSFMSIHTFLYSIFVIFFLSFLCQFIFFIYSSFLGPNTSRSAAPRKYFLLFLLWFFFALTHILLICFDPYFAFLFWSIFCVFAWTHILLFCLDPFSFSFSYKQECSTTYKTSYENQCSTSYK